MWSKLTILPRPEATTTVIPSATASAAPPRSTARLLPLQPARACVAVAGHRRPQRLGEHVKRTPTANTAGRPAPRRRNPAIVTRPGRVEDRLNMDGQILLSCLRRLVPLGFGLVFPGIVDVLGVDRCPARTKEHEDTEGDEYGGRTWPVRPRYPPTRSPTHQNKAQTKAIPAEGMVIHPGDHHPTGDPPSHLGARLRPRAPTRGSSRWLPGSSTGRSPGWLDARMTAAEELSAAMPWGEAISTRPFPTVRMMRHPPR